jgi:hypothetical protein
MPRAPECMGRIRGKHAGISTYPPPAIENVPPRDAPNIYQVYAPNETALLTEKPSPKNPNNKPKIIPL